MNNCLQTAKDSANERRRELRKAYCVLDVSR